LILAPVAIAQDELPDPPPAGSTEPIQPTIDQAQRSLELLMTAADKHLLWAIDLDSDRPGHVPSADVPAWLQRQSDAGDERLLAELAPKN